MREELDRRFCGRCAEPCGGFEEYVPSIDPPRRCVDCAIEVRQSRRMFWGAAQLCTTLTVWIVAAPILFLSLRSELRTSSVGLVAALSLPVFVLLLGWHLATTSKPGISTLKVMALFGLLVASCLYPPSRVAALMGIPSGGILLDVLIWVPAFLLVCGAGRAVRKRLEREREFVEKARERDLLSPPDPTKKFPCRRCPMPEVPEGSSVCPRCSAILFEPSGFVRRNIIMVHGPGEGAGA